MAQENTSDLGMEAYSLLNVSTVIWEGRGIGIVSATCYTYSVCTYRERRIGSWDIPDKS
jgi:hypothetical protein